MLPRLPSLTALSLRGSRTLSDAGLAALLRPLAPTLVTLCLSGCASVGEATYIALGGGVGSGAAPRLRELDLSCGAVPQATVTAWLLLPRLRRLDVSHNTAAFAQASFLEPLHRLFLSGESSARHPQRAPGAPRGGAELIELGADGCGLDDAACLRLVRCMPRLRVLSLADNGRLTAAAVAHLSTALPDLKWLDLSDTDLEPGWSGGDGDGGGGGGGDVGGSKGDGGGGDDGGPGGGDGGGESAPRRSTLGASLISLVSSGEMLVPLTGAPKVQD